jgi:hypothetical protein
MNLELHFMQSTRNDLFTVLQLSQIIKGGVELSPWPLV